MNRERALQVVLTAVGMIFLVGIYPLMMFLWPSGWRWRKWRCRQRFGSDPMLEKRTWLAPKISIVAISIMAVL